MNKSIPRQMSLQPFHRADSIPSLPFKSSIRCSTRKCLQALAFLALSLPLCAQLSLRNIDVIKMVNAGLGEDLIITTVNAAPGYYDTSVDGLHNLRSEGVTDKELSAIVQKAFHICFAGTDQDRIEGLQLGQMEHLLQEFHCGPQRRDQPPPPMTQTAPHN